MSLFKTFSPAKGDIASSTAVKSSVQRGMRSKLLEQYPDTLGKDEGVLLEQIWPKKEGIILVKFSREHVSILVHNKEPIFFQHFDGPYFPTMQLLQKYPFIMPSVQVDRGAIRFVLSGANIMSPGLTSAGGRLPEADKALPANAPVAIFAQGKEHPVAVGLLKMSTEDIRQAGKGIGIDNIHHIGDDLWAACAAGGL
ncbi:hypothetical protein K437DRAFT_192045 [Tilletiaria anomala UBC 951]|uniref:Translation machinery-associated protein 20 n=1 Tax=Tilletiaria anomala (strain ATCC 24038 / CBS 436.72 / UBC 951) TaxID=1037660 RepID=A0A066VEB1_TILAU|nr:uncharacterized protein K437DRAFT_192045 [Tilletiaria anomala UBC 951]KDN40087.1 hypothetical protein K437DRAFT_192045 [Tilletiaria anomala UBC 951]